MPGTAQQTRLAVMMDTYVTQVLAHGRGDAALLRSLADSLGSFKPLVKTSTGAEMDARCDHYEGFDRFATRLERLAQASPMAVSLCRHEGHPSRTQRDTSETSRTCFRGVSTWMSVSARSSTPTGHPTGALRT